MPVNIAVDVTQCAIGLKTAAVTILVLQVIIQAYILMHSILHVICLIQQTPQRVQTLASQNVAQT